MKFSIIIPMFNVEEYIERCVLSCLSQNLSVSEYEIILINDGSPDDSLKIAENLAIKNSNITILSQENQGLSIARNNGLQKAKGEYVWFVDSDDWIKENCILELYTKCLQFDLDVLLFGANDCDGRNFVKRSLPLGNVDFTIDGKSYLLSNQIIFPVCFKVFRREFLVSNNLCFMEGIMHEDNEFIPRALYYANKILCLNEVYYNVYFNPKSITRSVNPKKSFDLLKVAQSHFEFLNKEIQEEALKLLFCNYIGLAINSGLDNTKLMDIKNKSIFYFELEKHKHLLYYMKKSNKVKYKLEAQLFLFSPILFKKIYSIFLRYR